MVTCSCQRDPLGRTATELLSAVLRSESLPIQAALLHTVQKDLVRLICGNASDEIFWVQTYVEPAQELERELRGEADEEATSHLFLHCAADICDGAGAQHFYDKILLKRLNEVPANRQDDVWLSKRFRRSDVPPVVWLRQGGEGLISSWSDLRVDPLYEVLFADGRERGLYLHVAWPYRATPLNSHVGPAGAYLFLKEQASQAKLPSCLVFHLQLFVQSLVTAQLWAIGQSLQVKLKKRQQELRKAQQILYEKTKPLRDNFGLLGDLAKAADDLAMLADPIQIHTGALDAAHQLAKEFFNRPLSPEQSTHLRELGKRSLARLHDVRDWLQFPDDARRELHNLAARLDEEGRRADEDDDSIDLVAAISATVVAEVSSDDNNSTGGLERALRHAKALDHSSVVVALLVDGSNCLKSIRPYLPVTDAGPIDRYLRQALCALWTIRADREREFHLEYLDAEDELGIGLLRLNYSEPAVSVYEGALRFLDKGVLGRGEKRLTKHLAAILRGLGGDVRARDGSVASENGKNASEVDGRTVQVRIQTVPER